jgi:hypothetical protein
MRMGIPKLIIPHSPLRQCMSCYYSSVANLWTKTSEIVRAALSGHRPARRGTRRGEGAGGAPERPPARGVRGASPGIFFAKPSAITAFSAI